MFGYSSIFEFLIAALAIILAIVLHELAHGYVALWNGDATAKVNGRLTLNPVAHFDPLGIVMLLIARIGFARPVPINPNNFYHRKRGLFLVAISGVALNLIMAFLAVPLMMLCQLGLVNMINDAFFSNLFYYAYLFFSWSIVININLALFNLLPIHPLDGYNVIESFMRATNGFIRFMRAYGQYILIALIGIGIIVDSMGMPFYFDVLGLYINTVRNLIVDGFLAFWGLIF